MSGPEAAVDGEGRLRCAYAPAAPENAARAGTPPAAQANGHDEGRDKVHCRRQPASLPPEQRRSVMRFASALRKKHGPFDRPMAERIARLLRTTLVPRKPAGRPATQEVLLAVQLRQNGTPWPKVFEAVIHNYRSMPFYRRYYRGDKLRRAVGAYLRRRQTKRAVRRRQEASAA